MPGRTARGYERCANGWSKIPPPPTRSWSSTGTACNAPDGGCSPPDLSCCRSQAPRPAPARRVLSRDCRGRPGGLEAANLASGMADGSLKARENVPENSWRMRAYRLALDHVPPEGGNTLDINAVCCALCRELGALEVAVTLASLEPTDAVLGEANGGDTHLSDVEVTAAQGPAGEAVARRRPCLLPRLVEAFERWPGYVAQIGRAHV